jgi:hypothetical protein
VTSLAFHDLRESSTCSQSLASTCAAHRARGRASYSFVRCGLLYGPRGRPVATFQRCPRRNVFAPLEPTHEPRWHVARNMHGAVLESRLLLAATDLKRVFVAPMLEHIDGGWQLGEFGSRGGVFFCARGTERRMISITPTAAGQSGRMAPHIYPTHPGREKGD